MKKTLILCTVISTLALSACQTLEGRGNKELIGGASGALVGGILGSNVGGGSGRIWAAGAGVLLGTLIGSDIGASLDKADMVYARQASQTAQTAPIGEVISWNNPETGNSGSVTPKKDGYTGSGSYCREYEQTIIVGGQEETAVGTACRQADGSWKIVNE